jgi:hypothetical protein
MTPADLAAAGRTLTGSADRWRRPLARQLGVSEGFVRLMESGARPVPERIERQIAELVRSRRRELSKIAGSTIRTASVSSPPGGGMSPKRSRRPAASKRAPAAR